jgi:reactive intermediate/imine deaminase
MPDAVLLDGYVDEPACLGVPPYISPYIRSVAGVLAEHKYIVRYMTIDQIRGDPSSINALNSSELVVMIAGVTVPGKYLGGTPASLTEIRQIGTPPAGRPYSPGILAGNTLYISGRGDQLPDGGHPATFEEQVRQMMRNVGSVLKAAGLDFRHVVFSNVYIDKYENYGTVNKVYGEFFEYGNEPARATTFVDWIPGDSHIELTCIATTDLASRKVVRPPSMKYGPEESAIGISSTPGTQTITNCPGANAN